MIAYADSHTEAALSLLEKIEEIILFPLITLMMALAFLVFLYGAYEFVLHAGDEAARSKGKSHMLWGIIGFLIMLSAYAILSIAIGTFGCDLNAIGECGSLD